jgi:hypothetical protein
MKTILLAVDGMRPNEQTLAYALNLCSPIQAGLDILQIIRPQGMSRLKAKIYQARNRFEDAMVMATYAQAGVPELVESLEAKARRNVKRLIPEDIQTAVDYHCVVTGDHPDTVLKHYLDEHRGVILAIYDSIRFGAKTAAAHLAQRQAITRLLDKWSIPLVFVRNLKA